LNIISKKIKESLYFNKMTSKNKKWVEAGYRLLATDKLDGINIEKLAKTLKANKSGFYHHFGTREKYFTQLVTHHIDRAQNIATQMQECKTIDPDLLRLIVKEKNFFLVEAQLLLKGKSLKAKVDTSQAGRIIADELVALWRRHNEPVNDLKGALATVDLIRHYFYVRIDGRKINYPFLYQLLKEIKRMPNMHVYELTRETVRS
jgi:AcrR family transcriptional regulator